MPNPEIMTIEICGQKFYSAPIDEETRERVRATVNQKLHARVSTIELSAAAARAVFLGLAHAWDTYAEVEGKRKFRAVRDSLERMTCKIAVDLAREQASALKKAADETL